MTGERWSQEDVEYLRSFHNRRSVRQLSKHLGRSTKMVRRKLERLELSARTGTYVVGEVCFEGHALENAGQINARGGCKRCASGYLREYRKQNPDYVLAMRVGRHGLSLDDYRHMLEEQDGRCKICHSLPTEGERPFGVDHDHACCPGSTSCGKCVRGLLCARCNAAIGLFDDDPVRLYSAIEYLQEWAKSR